MISSIFSFRICKEKFIVVISKGNLLIFGFLFIYFIFLIEVELFFLVLGVFYLDVFYLNYYVF